jgi:hypothetical protein
MKKLDLIGKVFGDLTIISEHSTTRNGHVRWKAKCSCGNDYNVLGTHLQKGTITHCGCKRPRGRQLKSWTGVGDISGDFWYNHVVTSASGNKGNRRQLELSITKEEAWQLFLDQNKKCALSGLDLKFPDKNTDKSWTASLDRIDSSIGYTKENVQWVHKDINMMKRIYNNQYFIEMCKLVAKNTSNNCEVK